MVQISLAMECSSYIHEPIYTISSCYVFGLEVLLKLSVFSLFGPVNNDSLSIAFQELYPIGAAAILQGKQWTAKRFV